MTTTGAEQTTDVLMLANVLEKLRTRAGLTADRLRSDRTGLAAPLRELVAGRHFAGHADAVPAEAVVALVADCVRERLHGSQRLVADVMLALELHAEALSEAFGDRLQRSLYKSALGRRRETLLANWHELHDALEYPRSAAPSDRALRGSIELDVLQELAGQLIRADDPPAGRSTKLTLHRTSVPETSAAGRVIIVGGAVMDVKFRIKGLPPPETSTEAHGFERSPGGKGLTQAVAAARLGLKTSLIAAVADDAFGEEIMHYVENKGVDSSLIKRVRRSQTPFTGVLEQEMGDSIAINWRNQNEVCIEARDIDERYDELAAADVLLLTFEVPRDVVQHTLEVVHRVPVRRPLVIVTPGQPYSDKGISWDAFPRIDYLIAHAWELASFAPPAPAPFDPDPIARSLLVFGLDTLCLLVNGGCTIYSKAFDEPFSVPSIPSIYKEASAARDAFCAALATRLIDNDRRFTDEVAVWAAAAMSCAASDFPLPDPMPDRKRVDELLARSHLRPC
ncbi:PfkB family carbohydrate kinase [Kribbella pratensis]|uniref:Ribokinase n=1 Tax=Kribbella pratensis TaxID=2512112 RepID=A0A4R8CIE0_9ACTN|nr:carbohydrate kinase family protein [Kribbella pratensis]TDW76138.1 ribokinase [Kribbella pratensis]